MLRPLSYLPPPFPSARLISTLLPNGTPFNLRVYFLPVHLSGVDLKIGAEPLDKPKFVTTAECLHSCLSRTHPND
ncbi:hypothetical protein RRG08_060354 [Elysia crispata]|uniref:Uncharacterized protein n=1 Tax=Elysia crispata TaxID=231223 RepID=A0AAE0ZGK8_9GAST|nr:hypothetical protein RRG08_060354 [Elysia crispata]